VDGCSEEDIAGETHARCREGLRNNGWIRGEGHAGGSKAEDDVFGDDGEEGWEPWEPA